MATDDEIVLGLNIDSNVEDVTSQVDALTQSIDTNTQSVISGKQAYSEFRSETRAGLGNLLSLTKGTAEYNAELKKLASHKAEFQELQIQLQDLNPNQRAAQFARFGQEATKALQGIGGAATLVAGGNEEMVKTFIQTQAAVEVLNSLQDVANIKREAAVMWTNLQTTAQWLLNAAMDAWPITAIIAGVTAIIAVIGEWNHVQEKVIEQQQKIIDHLQKTKELYDSTAEGIKGHLQNELNLLIAQNTEYDKIENARNALHNQEVATAQFNVDNQEKQNIALEKQAKANEKQTEIMPYLQSGWQNILDIIAGDATSTIVGGIEKVNDKQKEFNDKVAEGKNKLTDFKNVLDATNIIDPAEKDKEKAKKQREADLKAQQLRDESLKESHTKELALLMDQHNEDLETLDKTSKQYNELRLAYDNKYLADRRALFQKYAKEDLSGQNDIKIAEANSEEETFEAQRKKIISERDFELNNEKLTQTQRSLIIVNSQNALLKLEDSFATSQRAKKEKEKEEDIQRQINKLDLQLIADKNYNDSLTGIKKNELKIIEDTYQKELLLAKGNAVAIAQANQNKNDAITASDKADQQAQLAFAGSVADSLVSIGDLLLAKGKEQTDGTKALALIQLGVKEAVSIANIVESSTANPLNSATFGAAGIAQMAAGIAGVLATFVSAKNILDGGSSSSTAIPSLSAGTTTAPVISSTNTNFNGTPTTNTNGNTDYGYGGAMTKVYVTQTDLTQSQNLAYIQNQRRRIH